MACEDVTATALYLGKALTRLRERTPPPALTHAEPAVFAHQHQGGARQQGPPLKRLPDVIPGYARLGTLRTNDPCYEARYVIVPLNAKET